MSNTMNAVRFRFEAAEVHRFWLPPLSGTLDQLADVPVFDGLGYRIRPAARFWPWLA